MTEEGGENWSVRQIELNRGYGFHCTCQACSLEDPEFESEEELRENLKQLQMAGAKNWDKGDVSEYLEGMGRLQGNVKHVMDVLAICFQASTDQVVAFFKGNICYRLTSHHLNLRLSDWNTECDALHWSSPSTALDRPRFNQPSLFFSQFLSQADSWRQKLEVLQLWRDCNLLCHG